MNIPNLLTTVRIALIPVFSAVFLYGRYEAALYIFVAASLTDFLDGLFARLGGQRTPLGTFLDPIADKFMLVTSFVLMSYHGFIPLWLTVTVISRDIIVITGWGLLYLHTHTPEVKPSVIGKTAIAAEFVLLCFVLLDINYGGRVPLALQVKTVLIWLAATFASLSGIQYVYSGLRASGERGTGQKSR
jgi:cardiolipin synthase